MIFHLTNRDTRNKIISSSSYKKYRHSMTMIDKINRGLIWFFSSVALTVLIIFFIDAYINGFSKINFINLASFYFLELIVIGLVDLVIRKKIPHSTDFSEWILLDNLQCLKDDYLDHLNVVCQVVYNRRDFDTYIFRPNHLHVFSTKKIVTFNSIKFTSLISNDNRLFFSEKRYTIKYNGDKKPSYFEESDITLTDFCQFDFATFFGNDTSDYLSIKEKIDNLVPITSLIQNS